MIGSLLCTRDKHLFCVLPTAESREKIWPVKYFRPDPMAFAVIHFTAMGKLLSIHVLLVRPLFCVLSLFCKAVLSVVSSYAILSLRKRDRAGCST